MLVWELAGQAYAFHIWRLEIVDEVGFPMPAKSEKRTPDPRPRCDNSNLIRMTDRDRRERLNTGDTPRVPAIETRPRVPADRVRSRNLP